MTLGNGLLTYSSISQFNFVIRLGVLDEWRNPAECYWLWMVLFGVSDIRLSMWHGCNPRKRAKLGGRLGFAFLSVPLYAYMAVITGVAFIFFMDYPMGQGIYLGQLVEFSGIFLNLALFIWEVCC